MKNLLHTEAIKHKGTLALVFVFLGPSLIVLLMMIQTVMWGAGFSQDMSPARFFIQNNLTLWSFLMLPFFITLITALSAYLEHKNKLWNVLLVGAYSRTQLFLAKIVFTVALVWLSYLAWLVIIHFGALLLLLFMETFGMWTFSDSLYVLSKISLMAVVSLPMILIHFWLANRFTNILVSFSFGVVVTILNFMVSSSAVNWLFPWSLPLLAAQPKGIANPIQVTLFLVIAVTILLTLCVRDLRNKEY